MIRAARLSRACSCPQRGAQGAMPGFIELYEIKSGRINFDCACRLHPSVQPIVAKQPSSGLRTSRSMTAGA